MKIITILTLVMVGFLQAADRTGRNNEPDTRKAFYRLILDDARAQMQQLQQTGVNALGDDVVTRSKLSREEAFLELINKTQCRQSRFAE